MTYTRAMVPPRVGLMVAILLLSAVLFACGPRTQPPAPVVSGAGTRATITPVPSGGSTAPAAPATPATGQVTVQPGETLYAVSRRANVPVRSLIEANRLEPPYDVPPGRNLALPAVPQHTVAPGETLYSISRVYGVDTSTLARSNQLAPPYAVSVGQVLTLPAPVQGAGRRGPAPVIQATAPSGLAFATPPTGPPAVPPTRTPPAAAPRPAIEPPPATAPAPPPVIAKPATPPVLEPPRVVERPSPPPPAAASPIPPAVHPAPREELAALPPPPLPPAPKQGEARFLWPVHGRILASYGTGANGTHNDGINIAAPAGTPVLAADAGVVAYAGNELRGYGNLLLVKHAGGWMTAYAHNSALLVKRGDRVKRGQEIARVGTTGAVGEPQLHFEIRQGTRALDPDDYLPPLAATAARG
jgi:murein DD-endopeptidase MepM/ murein hydrolase activator NlpD